ncbi:MAG: HEPN domain-containing protein [Candidatus Binataceae bacterium]
MPVDPALVAETRDWLIKASEDLEASVLLSKAALPALVAFHAQQAAEKAFTWHKDEFLKTHDLDILGDDCVAIDSNARCGFERGFSDKPLCNRIKVSRRMAETYCGRCARRA